MDAKTPQTAQPTTSTGLSAAEVLYPAAQFEMFTAGKLTPGHGLICMGRNKTHINIMSSGYIQ